MIDLHSHSTHSDGTLTPSELLILAKEKGIEYFAITDHDDIEGSKKLIESKHDGITVYSGVELNAKVDKVPGSRLMTEAEGKKLADL